MFQLVMSVLLIATFVAIGAIGFNVVQTRPVTRLEMQERISMEHLRLSLAIEAYRTATGSLPAEDAWLSDVRPWMEDDRLEDANRWIYLRLGEEFALCQSGEPDPDTSVAVLSCDAVPNRFFNGGLDVVGVSAAEDVAPGQAFEVGQPAVDLSSSTTTLRNRGDEAIRILDVRLAEGTNFRITDTDCTGVLAPGQSCSIEIVFFADRNGHYADTVQVFAKPAPDAG
ncbi:DUF1573 domain-containing protein [Cereibacter sphaeroides]|uniref:DUF1573 domain-containing protein n=1 Tax=Cereibacter sphaeroides TaxID=1063 RepID=UPI001F21CA97|nr:DUF1573 domain-containing protein [Cereibacter sphaeroides]MCE6959709.1 DUF1573 domain-containing protein [Cereibacter sphaeroides]MCE6974430.1 DUF1573 domain-containing protein [Cereibacter sphaeroides]